MSTLGSTLRQARKEKGLSVDDLSERSDTSTATIYGWESGKNLPSNEKKLKKVVSAMRLPREKRVKILSLYNRGAGAPAREATPAEATTFESFLPTIEESLKDEIVLCRVTKDSEGNVTQFQVLQTLNIQ